MSKIIYINDKRYNVKKFKEGEKLKKGTAYILGDCDLVLPYLGKYKDKKYNKHGAGIYMLENNDYRILKPMFNQKEYSPDRVKKVDLDDILDILDSGDISDASDDIILSDTGAVFAPPINEGDNILQKIVKTCLIEKQTDLKNYLPRFKDQTDMNNFKRSILNGDNLSFQRFEKGCEILDIDYEIIFRDKDNGVAYPMGEGFEGSSKEL